MSEYCAHLLEVAAWKALGVTVVSSISAFILGMGYGIRAKSSSEKVMEGKQ